MQAGLRLGRGREERFGEARGILQSFRQRYAADGARSLVVVPSGAGDVTPGDAFHGNDLTGPAQHDAPSQVFAFFGRDTRHVRRIGRNEVMTEAVGESLEPEPRYLRQHHALAGQSVLQDDIERADAVGGDDEQARIPAGQRDIVKIPDLAGAAVG